MKRKNGHHWMMRLAIPATLVAMFWVTGCSEQNEQPVSPNGSFEYVAQTQALSKDNPGVKRAMEVQDRNTERFLAKHGVVGTGTGLDAEGNPAVIVFTERELGKDVVPTSLEGIPVIERVVGEVEPVGMKGGGNTKSTASTKKVPPGQTSTSTPTPNSRHPRPVPIGVSTGNIIACGGGTIGLRVRNGDNYYAISCNHVWGRLNAAQVGESIVQPGGLDVACAAIATDIVATVADLEPIVHLSTANNIMDAVLVATSTANMGNSTPVDGYGIPSSTPVDPMVGMSVQKYGRTTGLTAGKISAINVTLGLNYGYGTARFVGQIAIEPSRNKAVFVDSGDSGSLVVTDDDSASPVGLVFAKAGDLTYANPIKPILARFNVVVDGK